MGRNWKFWYFPTWNVTSHGTSRKCVCDSLGFITWKVLIYIIKSNRRLLTDNCELIIKWKRKNHLNRWGQPFMKYFDRFSLFFTGPPWSSTKLTTSEHSLDLKWTYRWCTITRFVFLTIKQRTSYNIDRHIIYVIKKLQIPFSKYLWNYFTYNSLLWYHRQLFLW